MKKYFLLVLLVFFISGCGGGGSSSSDDTLSNNINSSVVIRSIVVPRDDITTDKFVADKCGTRGGVAIYSGIDKNGNGILDDDEKNEIPQVVCNGEDGSNIEIENLERGDEHCPYGGVALKLNNTTSYICSADVNTNVEDNNSFTQTGSIKGVIDITDYRKFVITNKRNVISMQGGLWLTPSKIEASIEVDKIANSDIPETITKPIKVDIRDDNSYEIPNVPSGKYSLVYVEDDKGKKIDDIYVSPGQVRIQDITQIASNGSVKLKVASLDGKELNNAIVRLNELDKKVDVDENGEATIENLPEGVYSLTISADGYVSKYITFRVNSGSVTDLQTIELNTQKGEIAGKVEIEGLDNLANIIVYAKSKDGSVYTTLTNSDGSYKFNSLPIGEGYSVLAMAHDYGANKVDNINVEQDKEITVPTLTLKKSSILMGSVAGFARFAEKDDALSYAGIIVSIEGTDYEAITARDGSFILNNIPAGNYVINFTDSNHNTETDYIKVVAGATITLDKELKLVQGQIQGAAVLSNNSPVGIKVELLGTNYYTYTDGVGKYTLQVPIGNYPNGIRFSKALYETKIEKNTITVVENGIYNVPSVTLNQIAQNVEGNVKVNGVTDYNNTKILIEGISDSNKGVEGYVYANQNGDFEIEALPFGKYKYTITYPDNLHETIVGEFELNGDSEVQKLGEFTLKTSFVLINNDEEYTNNKDVTLSIGNSKAAYMQIKEGNITYDKEAIADTKNITLSDGDGEKTVIVDFYDANDNPLESVSDSIILDTTLKVNKFELDGAKTKGDTLKIFLELNETNAKVLVDIPNIASDLQLLDNGTGGDLRANDGIYSRSVVIKTPLEINTTATASIIDRASNSIEVESNNSLVLSTPPTISGLKVVSNVAKGTMSISFITDEPTTSVVYYGDSIDNLDKNETISSILSTNHSITLENLSSNEITYFKIVVEDSAQNVSSLISHGKLAPPPPIDVTISAGDNEIGLLWDKVDTSNVVGYNVYRKESDSFVKINNEIITNNYFVDETAENGITYTYKITTLDDNDNESESSKEVSATPDSSLAGPTNIDGGVIKKAIWLPSRSPYNITANMKVEGELLATNLTINLSSNIDLLTTGVFNGYNITLNGDKNVTTLSVSSEGSINLYNSKITNIYPTQDIGGKINIYSSNFLVDLETSYLVYMNLYISNFVDSNLSLINNDKDYRDKVFHISYIKNSNLKADNYSDDIMIYTAFIFDSDISNIKIDRDSSTGNTYYISCIKNCKIYNSNISNFYTMTNNEIVDSKIRSIINFNFNIVDKNVTFYSLHDVRYNYWNTLDIKEISDKIEYKKDETLLYPIISSKDLYNADFDNDGIPDYIDNDNDNDGYSDLQEEKESDLAYNLLYNPLDNSSYPDVAKDNDIDGIADDEDDDDDNDKISDDDEINYNTNPKIADSDGDGVIDGIEIQYSYDPLDNTNFPIYKNIYYSMIDEKYENEDGKIYVIDNVKLINVDIKDGMYILLLPDSQLNIQNSDISASKIAPIIIRGDEELYIGNSNLRYFNIKVSKIEDESIMGYRYTSTIKYSDIDAVIYNLKSIEYCAVYQYISGLEKLISSYVSNYVSYIKYISNSYLYSIYSSDLIESSFVSSGYINNANKEFKNSIIKNGVFSSVSVTSFENSDVEINERTGDAVKLGIFLNNCYLEYNGKNYDGLGEPEDTMGDSIIDTKIQIDDKEFFVDGIKSPKNTKNFPEWSDDPSIKQYFWDPTNVGCLWNKDDPDTFPEP